MNGGFILTFRHAKELPDFTRFLRMTRNFPKCIYEVVTAHKTFSTRCLTLLPNRSPFLVRRHNLNRHGETLFIYDEGNESSWHNQSKLCRILLYAISLMKDRRQGALVFTSSAVSAWRRQLRPAPLSTSSRTKKLLISPTHPGAIGCRRRRTLRVSQRLPSSGCRSCP